MAVASGSARVLLYLLRRDLRVADNPILHYLASTPASEHGFTHLLPVYVFAAHQIEVSGFCRQGTTSPYPEARGRVTGFWRCGPHRSKFTAQSVWDVKTALVNLDSGLVVRVGRFEHVTRDLIQGLGDIKHDVGAVWMTKEEPSEEEADEQAIAQVCSELGVSFRAWADEKYFVDNRDLSFESPDDLQPIFTDFRKALEPLREKPRGVLPSPVRSQLPKFPDASLIPAQSEPFEMPESYAGLEARLLAPLTDLLENPPEWPRNARSAHPFDGGETKAHERLQDVITSGGAVSYKQTRNGLVGADFSTKLSAYLALGSLTARQIHEALSAYESGTNPRFKHVEGYAKGENEGTYGIRFELMWRDYMRLCTRQYKEQLFQLSGFRQRANKNKYDYKWRTPVAGALAPDDVDPNNDPERTAATLQRFLNGTTGMGFIDASQRELFHTGYTSNRARQNVASFLAKHLCIDWRCGAEWYECMLTDYDTCSNWCNWQYVAGVGNDPRSGDRIFNPVKQAFDYDAEGTYVKMWVPELRSLKNLENVFQVWTTPDEERDEHGLVGLPMVESPVKQISFSLNRWPRGQRRPFAKRAQPGRRGGASGGTGGAGGHGSKGATRGPSRGYSHPNGDASCGNGGGRDQGYGNGKRGGFPVRSRDGQDGHVQSEAHQRGTPSSGQEARCDGGSADGDEFDIATAVDNTTPIYRGYRIRSSHTRSYSVG